MLWRWLGLIFVLSFGALGFLGWQIYLTGAAHPQDRRHHRRRGALHRRADPARPAGLAGQRRPAAGQRLGPRRLRRAGLVGRLAAPRSDGAAGDCAPRRCASDPAALTAADRGAIDAAAEGGDAPQHLRRRQRRRDGVARARRGDPRGGRRTTQALFGNDPSLANAARPVRDDGRHACPQQADREALTAFFFWTSWAAATDRPGETDLSYTSNWPHEPLVGNTLTDSAAMWSMVSIVLLLAGIAAMLWLHGAGKHEAEAAAAEGRSAGRRRRHAVDEGHPQVLLRRGRPDAAADRHGRRSPRTTRSKASRSSACRWRKCCPMW